MIDRIINKISKFLNITIEDIRNLKTLENLNEVHYFVNSKIKLTDDERIRDMKYVPSLNKVFLFFDTSAAIGVLTLE